MRLQAKSKQNAERSLHCKDPFYFNKPYEDGFSYEWDGALNLNAGLEDLMDDSVDNQTEYISVGTFFRSCFPETRRVWLIDTPGVNSADNVEHKIITEKLIRETDPDMVICVLNGQAIGTDDERKHLLFLKEQCRCRILFVINKVDSYRKMKTRSGKHWKLPGRNWKRSGSNLPVWCRYLHMRLFWPSRPIGESRWRKKKRTTWNVWHIS